MSADNPIADEGAAAGDDTPIQDPRQEAGQDESIAKRLARDPSNEDAKLDTGIDESMDASDPPSVTAPGSGEPADSSGYDEEAERQRDA